MGKYKPYRYKVVGFEGVLIAMQLFKNQLNALKYAATLFKPEIYEIKENNQLRLFSEEELAQLKNRKVNKKEIL